MSIRSLYCGQLRESHIGKRVDLCGWVDRWRDHGGVVFIDLRDREGLAQIVFDPAEYDEAGRSIMEPAGRLRQEFVISVSGTVRSRPDGMTNAKLPTGQVEVLVDRLEILNESEVLPFSLHEDSPSAGEVDESIRLKYRYLDLRRPRLQKNLILRHQFLKAARDYYFNNDFIEIETPILYKSTPEGARDYLVPSRLHGGKFYALPQSPQTLKQLCMISGFDRYIQVARCFRDEDLRADRQPEFTQIDVEMSFIDEEIIFQVHEGLMAHAFQEVLGEEIKTPFTRMTYKQAMDSYGSDKPDLRNSLQLVDLSEEGKKSTFKIYESQLASGGVLKGLCIDEKEPLSRKELDSLPAEVATFGAKGLSWIRIKGPGDWQSPVAKFFSEDLKKEVEARLPPSSHNRLLLLVCAPAKVVNQSLSYLRDMFGRKLGYFNEDRFNFLWVTDFPLFEYDESEKRLYAAHHPFTRVHPDDLNVFLESSDPAQLSRVRARAYDLVINGYEAGGGSLRIFRPEEQRAMFRHLNLSEEEQRNKFGFFLKALSFGTPPHGGIALGVDRIAMVLAGTDAIRDVIAFPKTQKAACAMSEAPSEVDEQQLRELSIKLR